MDKWNASESAAITVILSLLKSGSLNRIKVHLTTKCFKVAVDLRHSLPGIPLRAAARTAVASASVELSAAGIGPIVKVCFVSFKLIN